MLNDMEPDNNKVETMLDDIDRLKAEKCRLQERLNAVRSERMRKQAISAARSQKRAAMEIMLANKGEHLKMIQHRVAQDKAQFAAVRKDIAAKRESIKQRHAAVMIKTYLCLVIIQQYVMTLGLYDFYLFITVTGNNNVL